MKKMSIALLFLLLVAALSACGEPDPLPQDTTALTDTEAQTVPEVPAETDPATVPETETPADGFDAVRDSKELWLTYGLDAYLAGREAPDLSAFFADSANMVYLTLYPDMFLYDEARSVPVAEAFFRFVTEEYGKDALLDTEKRIEYKSAYLASLGVESGYLQDPAVEALLSRMTVSADKDWKYILTVDNTGYYLNDFKQGTISQYHAMFYSNNKALDELLAYIREHTPDTSLDLDHHFRYFLTFDGTGISFTLPDGRMSINEMHSMLHESLHAMGLSAEKDEYLWLTEGLCNYMGKFMGFNPQFASVSVQMLKMAESGYFDERAEAGDETAVFYRRLWKAYTAAGGSLASSAEFDLLLYNDLYAVLERAVYGEETQTIADAYKALNKRDYTAPGTELTYAEATSMVTYLVETYGFDKVMKAAQNEDAEGTLGKSYEELKALWQASLPTVDADSANRP